MKYIKVEYSTAYDNYDNICGYVLAYDDGNHLIINRRQYARALSKRTIGGNVAIIWHTDRDIKIEG